MKTRSIKVTDKYGVIVDAHLIICPNCNEDTFYIFMINSNHQHLQCCVCDETFCDGSCK